MWLHACLRERKPVILGEMHGQIPRTRLLRQSAFVWKTSFENCYIFTGGKTRNPSEDACRQDPTLFFSSAKALTVSYSLYAFLKKALPRISQEDVLQCPCDCKTAGWLGNIKTSGEALA